ncbi:MAG: copper-binding protein [Dehalococcoidia bacterium]|nr:copper-binding protein [Dehalococcoidia bacterium]
MRRVLLIVIGGVTLLLGAACGSGSLDAAAVERTEAVQLKDNKFDARVIQVSAGATVTWSWAEDRLHNVTGDGWASPNQESGTFRQAFDQPGAYDYRCTLHGGMTGRVVVTD